TRRPDLQVSDIRGNVETRLGFVTSGELDAVVLAAAGLHRVDRAEAITEYLDLADWPTAPGQGVLAVEVREEEDRADLLTALEQVHDPAAWAAVTAERAVLATLEAGCAAPVAAHATAGEVLTLHAAAYHPTQAQSLRADGSEILDDAAPFQTATALGQRLADELLEAGAGDGAPPGRGPRPRRWWASHGGAGGVTTSPTCSRRRGCGRGSCRSSAPSSPRATSSTPPAGTSPRAASTGWRSPPPPLWPHCRPLCARGSPLWDLPRRGQHARRATPSRWCRPGRTTPLRRCCTPGTPRAGCCCSAPTWPPPRSPTACAQEALR